MVISPLCTCTYNTMGGFIRILLEISTVCMQLNLHCVTFCRREDKRIINNCSAHQTDDVHVSCDMQSQVEINTTFFHCIFRLWGQTCRVNAAIFDATTRCVCEPRP